MYRYSESVEVFFLQGEENLFFLPYAALQAAKPPQAEGWKVVAAGQTQVF
ncbi:hypothetical protein SGRA_0500 [Saprospira grandis str. Lewin]|uniref:Uncharacterized protein n=1 Tax=Saprospira grandis (strain Lewin) TaxID=984262 RepID=H6L9R1_SAPGL|nr:hypothetical protein SGRA_0500 [Saprospira grandis str. Lewin]